MSRYTVPASAYPPQVRTVAAHGLLGSTHQAFTEPLADPDFRLLLSVARMQRITGLLWAAVTDDALPVTDDQAQQCEQAHLEASAAALVLERLLVQTVTALERGGIPVRVLKGSAVAHLDYPDPSMRTFGDIDLLVPGKSFDDAVQTIGRLGHQRQYPEPRPGYDRRFTKGTSFRTADRLEIDLHRTFVMGPFGLRLSLERLWETSSSYELGGVTLQALAPEARFLHACYHAALGGTRPRLSPLRDVAQIALGHDLDLGTLHELIQVSGGEPVVSRAVRTAWYELALADVLAISAWADVLPEDDRARADLAVYGTGSSYAAKSLAAVRAVPSLREKAAFLLALTLPQRSYVGRGDTGRLDRLRRGYRQIAAHRRHP